MANITEMQTFGDLQHLVVDADPSTSAGTPGVVSSLLLVLHLMLPKEKFCMGVLLMWSFGKVLNL
jgi:hypothetical protein